MPASYKPSPLGYGSPRSSPFRRPESPSLPSAQRQTTPTKVGAIRERFGSISSATGIVPPESPSRTPRRFGQQTTEDNAAPAPTPPSLGSPVNMSSMRPLPSQPAVNGGGNALSQLQPAQVRVMRDGFQILDRDSDGVVNREDVTDMLNQLGLPSSAPEVSKFFPAGGPQTMTLAVFLNSIASSLAAMSPATELLSAFSAFDDDDSGQVDLAELRDALLHTAPEPGERAPTAAEVDRVIAGFSGRRAFGKHMAGGLGKRGEVFRYQEFVNSVLGSRGNGSGEAGGDGEDSEA
ncbi:EF-hand [Xylariaceae sp. FL0016]|nr:EF-hand [Xylariaceae sp. FL0016]